MPTATIDQRAVDAALTILMAANGQGTYQKAGTAGTTPSTPYLHGPGGIFGVAGLERDMLSTHVRPMGLLSALPARGSIDDTPLFAYITGFQDITGSEKDGVCDDPPTAGAIKGCIQVAQFGRYERQTRTIEVNRIGLRINRGEMDDLRLMNPASAGGSLYPSSAGTSLSMALNAERQARMLELGVAMERKLAKQVWTGNPSNNSANGGSKEFPGLEILVGTTKVDALTHVSCPSLASDVKAFNYRLVSDDPSGTGGIIATMAALLRYLTANADMMGFSPVQFVWVMRPDAFYAITDIWPCAYYTSRCVAVSGTETTIDAQAAVDLRDRMRRGKFLLVDGEEIPVILDNMIPEDTNANSSSVPAGSWASDIYLLPLTVMGGYESLYMEYLDYQQTAMAGADMVRAGNSFWTDGGRFLWHRKTDVNWCEQLMAKIEPRIVLRTPHLAGRITDVRYQVMQHTRDADPSSSYWIDGGQSSARTPQEFFSDWNPS